MATSAPGFSSTHPPLGTLIDSGAFELVEVLGVGGYGVVYRAVDARTPYPQSYAVKCLLHSPPQSHSRRNHHIREIALHQIASGHQGVVTLHKVVQDYDYTYIIMDYASDHDLFTQILNNRRYLGDDIFVKHIFLQLLDAVEYIHSLGIYHRDLKPENILCFDGGYRIAITDFGLATTDKTSSEFKTGSVYHMSPECQGGEFAPTGIYSPRFNDIWSLGIILLNLTTGRNPWKSATTADPTFQAYLQDPLNFLPSVLPISPAVNDILVRVLDVDWRRRLTLRQLRRAIENLDTFYADGVVFEGSLARCPWEVGVDLDFADEHSGKGDLTRRTVSAGESIDLKSHWSDNTEESDIVFTETTLTQEVLHNGPWSSMVETRDPDRRTWLAEMLGLSKFREGLSYDESNPPITYSPTSPYLSDGSSLPPTPDSKSSLFSSLGEKPRPTLRHKLTIDTALVSKPRYYDPSDLTHLDEIYTISSSGSSTMHTAVETISYPSSFVMASSRESDVLQSPESIDLSSIVIPDLQDLGPNPPWNLSKAEPALATVADVTFTSRYPSTRSIDLAIHDSKAPPDFGLSGFCMDEGSDGGGGRVAEEPYVHGAPQEEWGVRKGRRMTSPDDRSFNPFARMGSGSSSPVPSHPQKSHGRRPSEPLVSARLSHREDEGKNGWQRQLDSHLRPLDRLDSFFAMSQSTSPKFPPAALQQARRGHEGYRRSSKPWFFIKLFT
ncbi:hypothetical protein APHAL10511_006798 [Amanita phalloides]|nr:hypothetical protein APHAL10511_006798 [Amanita phalloides]